MVARGVICYGGEKGEGTATTMDGPRRRRATISHDGWPMIGGKAIISSRERGLFQGVKESQLMHKPTNKNITSMLVGYVVCAIGR